MVRVLIVGDLHGHIPKIYSKDFDIIICPGDICGDDIRPYIKKWILKRTKTGFDVDFDEFVSEKKQIKLHKESLKKGRIVLKHLNSFKKPVFVVPGNWDPSTIQDGRKGNSGELRGTDEDWKKLLGGLKNIVDVRNKKVTHKGLDIIGHGSTSAPEPIEEIPEILFDSEEEFKDYSIRHKYFHKIMTRLSKYFSKAKNPVIFITHNVPYDTKLDKVFAPKTYAHKKHYGSKVARELIEEHQPMLCIGGHIHEGYGKVKIKKTLCINAGFGGLVNTIVEIDDKKGKVSKVEFLGRNKKNL